MGILNDTQSATLGNHTIEVRADNHIWQGLIYTLFFDGEVVATTQNFWKIPTQRQLEAQLDIDGASRHVAVDVNQGWLTTNFSLMIDGAPLELAS